MKKGLLISLIAASILSAAQANSIERINTGWMGMADFQEHVADTKHEKEQKQEQSHTAQAAGEASSHGEATTQEGKAGAATEATTEQSGSSEYKETSMHEGGGFFNTEEMFEHKNEFQNQYGDKNATAQGHEDAKEGMGYAHDEEQTYEKEYLSFVEIVKEEPKAAMPSLPKEVKEIVSEAKKAIKLYKKEELFKDLNITDLADLQKPEIKEQIKALVEKAKKEREKEIAHKLLQKKVAKVAGEFIKFGEGQYDWAFVTKTGEVYKLAGVSENGMFKYQKLAGVQGVIEASGKVQIQALQITNDVEAKLANKQFNGYAFAKYNDAEENGFDWVVVVGNKVYKLEGYDEESGSFVYTEANGVEAQTKGEEVVLLPGQEG